MPVTLMRIGDDWGPECRAMSAALPTGSTLLAIGEVRGPSGGKDPPGMGLRESPAVNRVVQRYFAHLGAAGADFVNMWSYERKPTDAATRANTLFFPAERRYMGGCGPHSYAEALETHSTLPFRCGDGDDGGGDDGGGGGGEGDDDAGGGEGDDDAGAGEGGDDSDASALLPVADRESWKFLPTWERRKNAQAYAVLKALSIKAAARSATLKNVHKGLGALGVTASTLRGLSGSDSDGDDWDSDTEEHACFEMRLSDGVALHREGDGESHARVSGPTPAHASQVAVSKAAAESELKDVVRVLTAGQRCWDWFNQRMGHVTAPVANMFAATGRQLVQTTWRMKQHEVSRVTASTLMEAVQKGKKSLLEAKARDKAFKGMISHLCTHWFHRRKHRTRAGVGGHSSTDARAKMVAALREERQHHSFF